MYQNITVLNEDGATTKTNRPYKKLTIKDEAGKEHKVNIFSDFPSFADIKVGSVIRGKLEENGKYMNLVSEVQTRPQGNSNYKQVIIEKSVEKAQETKRQDITRFQDQKEFSIMVASSMTNAVNLAIAEYRDKTVLDTLDQAVLKWRTFILDNWLVDPKDIKPF